jgi:hypothetical protein
LDNWGINQHATSQHLWNWKTNIDGGVEVIREKATIVNNLRQEHDRIINRWNRENQNDPVSDSLYIKAGENCHVLNTVDTQNQEKYVKK